MSEITLSASRKKKIADQEKNIARYKGLIDKAEKEIERLQKPLKNGKVSEFSKEERKNIVDAVLVIEKDENVSFKIGVNRYMLRNSGDPRSEKLDVNTVGDWKRKIYPSETTSSATQSGS